MYTVTDLGTLGEDSFSATALNNRGQIVGSVRTADGRTRACLWEAGTLRDLGTYRRRRFSYAWGINDAGVVVGQTLTADDWSRGIVWVDGRARDVGALAGGESHARAINNRGQVVGDANVPDDGSPPWDIRAILYESGTLRELKTPGWPDGWCYEAWGINDAGVVVGSLFTRVGDQGRCRAFILDTRASDAVRLIDPLPGDNECYACGINDAGQVVGWSDAPARDDVWMPPSRAFLYADGMLHELAPPPGYQFAAAAALNNLGQVVGATVDPDREPHGNRVTRSDRALLWQDGTVLDLNDLGLIGQGWVLGSANDINDAGQIVANGYRGEQRRAFLLTPR